MTRTTNARLAGFMFLFYIATALASTVEVNVLRHLASFWTNSKRYLLLKTMNMASFFIHLNPSGAGVFFSSSRLCA